MAINVSTASGERQQVVHTLQKWITRNSVDLFTGHFPLWTKLYARKRIVGVGFGDDFVLPIHHPAAGGPVARGVVDPLIPQSLQVVTGMSRYTVKMAEYHEPYGIPVREVMANDGAEVRRVNYQATASKIVMLRFLDKLRQDSFAAESAAGANGSESSLVSLLALINKGSTAATGPYEPKADPYQYSADNDSVGWSDAIHGIQAGSPASYTFGGIDRNAAGNVYFNCPVINPSTAETMGRDAINKVLLISGIEGRNTADLLVLGFRHYAYLLGVLQGQQQLRPSRLTDYGFEAFRYMQADVVWQGNIPAGRSGGTTSQALAINTGALTLACATLDPRVVDGGEEVERPLHGYALHGFYQYVPEMLGRGLGARHGNLASV